MPILYTCTHAHIHCKYAVFKFTKYTATTAHVQLHVIPHARLHVYMCSHDLHTHHMHTKHIIVRRIFLPVVDENYEGGGTPAAAASSGSVLAMVENGSHDHTGLEEEEVTAEEYVTIESYQADGPGQVSFKEGENVHVLEKLEDGKILQTS